MFDLPTPDNPFRIGTRGSDLALWQAQEVRRLIMGTFSLPEEAFEIVPIKVTGDAIRDRALREAGGKGLFTREIEQALLDRTIHVAVHSMKDMPTVLPGGLIIDCHLPRADVRDAFISREYGAIAELPAGATVGTSSLRRRAQVLARRPDLKVIDFRGNVGTRLQKIADGVADATFLAMAGLMRLGKAEEARHAIPPEEMLPAIAQGVIGVERREDDASTAALLLSIHDRETGLRVEAERAFLRRLDGSCRTPIAGLAEITGTELRLRGEILRPDGTEVFADEVRGAVDKGADLGVTLAETLLSRAPAGFLAG